MDVRTSLCREIQDEFKSLKVMTLGTEEYNNTVDGLTKLVAKSIEMDRFDLEKVDKESEKKNRWIEHIIAGVGIVLPVMVTIWGTKASFKFEETGCVTTIMGRGFISKLLPRK